MPHDVIADLRGGMLASVLLTNQILALQGDGCTAREVAWKLKISRKEVIRLAREAGQPFGSLTAYAAVKSDPRPPSRGLLESFLKLRPGRCAYIEGHVHDPDARVCGEPCCIITLGWRWPYRSSYCAEHHPIVYEAPTVGGRRID